MRRALKSLAGALAVLLLAAGLAACGGGSDESSTPSSTESTQAQVEGSGSSSKGDEAKPGKAKGGESEGSSTHESEAKEFTPKQHSDSGGGSQQFVQKGGDNSVQEYGEEAGQGEFEAAAAALHDFLDARAEGNWAAACEYMSKSIAESLAKLASQAKQLKDTSCAAILEKLTSPATTAALKQEADQADVGSLRIEGERAFVIFKGPNGAILTMPMIHEADGWRVGGLAGSPLN